MKHFKYYSDDYRADGANDLLHALFLKHNSDIKSPLFRQELEYAYEWIKDHVRNIYEVIDTEIPLMAYHQVLTNGHKGYGEWESYGSKQEALDVIEKEYKEILKKFS